MREAVLPRPVGRLTGDPIRAMRERPLVDPWPEWPKRCEAPGCDGGSILVGHGPLGEIRRGCEACRCMGYVLCEGCRDYLARGLDENGRPSCGLCAPLDRRGAA